MSSVRRRALLLGLGLAALVTSAVPAAAAPPRGIDVSMWQGTTVNWHSVRSSGIAFAFVKASQNTSFVDPQYAVNVANARAAGVAVGAYDFADPRDGTAAQIAANARADAIHFLTVARPQPTDLRPVIDVEQTNGLSPTELTLWVRTWVTTVASRVHARPLIYTSPSFWQLRLANTRTIAAAADLWVAHWTTAAQPWVPASDWAGHGWSFWQFSDCSHVPGIPGCVDADRVAASTLLPYRIGSIPASRAAPIVSGTIAVYRTLAATRGSWRGTWPITYTYQWQRCNTTGTACLVIPGATGLSYQTVPADYQHTLRFRITAHNRLGTSATSSLATVRTADLTPPTTPTVGALIHYQPTAAFAASWQATDSLSGIATYDVQVRRLGSAVAGPWQDALVAQNVTTLPLTGSAGQTTCVRSRAHDRAGNASAWSGPACTAVPLAATGLPHTGTWYRHTTTGALSTSQQGAAVYRTGITANEIGLRVHRCTTCGAVNVYWSGHLVRSIDLHAAASGEITIRVPLGSRPVAGSIRLVTTTRRPVMIDSVGLLRTS